MLNISPFSSPKLSKHYPSMADARSVLPLECWELIINLVDNLEAVSSVCKDFLSLSNCVRAELNVFNSPVKNLTRLLQRFRGLKKIDLSEFRGDINLALLEISRSGLNLESLNLSHHQDEFPIEVFRELGSCMKNLKTLAFSGVRFKKGSDLIVIISSLPWLEEIDISNSVGITDALIEILAIKLPNLQKIDISGNFNLSKESLIALSLNCTFLREIKAWDCRFISQDCISHVFRHCPNLVSLSMADSSPLLFIINHSVAYAKNLCDLELSSQSVPDSILSAIVRAHLPLKNLGLSRCRDFTIKGLLMLLRAYQSLEKLNLEGAKFLNDDIMSCLSKYLYNLTYINLNSCRCLTGSTFFTLIRNSPLLVKIEMAHTNLGAEEDLDMNSSKNYNIKNLSLYHCSYLNNELLTRIGLRFPNLQLLDVRMCFQITCDGIGEIFKCCNKLKHLQVYIYDGMKMFGTDSELSTLNLEVLEVSKIDDEEMATIAKRCPELRKLSLEHSMKVTNKGMMAVLEKCKKLREVKLRECRKVDVHSLPGILVYSRAFGWKTTPPSYLVPNRKPYEYELRDKYLICNRQVS